MKSAKNILIILFAVFSSFIVTGCSVQRNSQKSVMLNAFNITRSPGLTFRNLNNGVKTEVQTTPENTSGMKIGLSNESQLVLPTKNYVRQMGFVEKGTNNDYVLRIKMDKVEVNTFSGTATVELNVSLLNQSGKVIYSQQATGGKTNAFYMPAALNEAYTLALEQVDWFQLASLVRD